MMTGSENNNRVADWIALNSVKGLGPVRIKKLIDEFGSPDAVFRQSPAQLSARIGITRDIASQLHDPVLHREAQQQCDKARILGIEVVTLDQKAYPPLLRTLYAPPPVLYIKGEPTVFSEPAVAVVGTRRPTAYGKAAAARLVSELVDKNYCIVSGLALGIDTVAHRTCLEKGGKTVAVLGCGIDRTYPDSNRNLAERICRGGALVSEFPLGTQPEAFNFPRRNRIISGLSRGVVVIEAGEKSGGLITAHFALQQERDVFAVPGSIFSAQSRGTNALIGQGAVPVQSAGDIIKSLAPCETEKRPPGGDQSPFSFFSEHDVNSIEAAVLSLLSSTPQRIDTLSEKTGHDVACLCSHLLNLELKGLIRQEPGQLFLRV